MHSYSGLAYFFPTWCTCSPISLHTSWSISFHSGVVWHSPIQNFYAPGNGICVQDANSQSLLPQASTTNTNVLMNWPSLEARSIQTITQIVGDKPKNNKHPKYLQSNPTPKRWVPPSNQFFEFWTWQTWFIHGPTFFNALGIHLKWA